ncbi:metabotropic GABA-B receptor subtype 3 [Carabus blaptoides fortunei]
MLETNEMFKSELYAAEVSVSKYAPQTYDAVWAIALALSGAERIWRSANNITVGHFDYTRRDMATEFLQQLAQLNFLGISGPVSFSGADRVGTSAFHQVQG